MNNTRNKLIKIRFWIFQIFILLFLPVILTLSVISYVFGLFFEKQKNISGEIALITGSGNGLGKKIAIALAKKGCHIAVVDIDEEAAEATSRELVDTYQIRSKAFKVDIAKYENLTKLAKDVEEQLGPVTILVNNAGMMMFRRHMNPTPDEIKNMIDINLTSQIYTVRMYLEKMIKLGKGHIVSISSIAGFFPCSRQLEYSASKFGIRGLMMELQAELFALNAEFIKTTTVFPFFMTTNAIVDSLSNDLGISKYYPTIPGEEVAEAVVEGIVKNKTEVFMPNYAGVIYGILRIFPTKYAINLLKLMATREQLRRYYNSILSNEKFSKQ